MPDRFLPQFLRSFRRAMGPGGQPDLTDADLLRRFVEQKDPAAFEVLVWRHAALVLAVCRRILRRPADVDDAFQATFLVFLQRAGSIRQGTTLAGLVGGSVRRCRATRRIWDQSRRRRAL